MILTPRKRKKSLYCGYIACIAIVASGLALTLLNVEVSYILGVQIKPHHHISTEENNACEKIDISFVVGGYETARRVVTVMKSVLMHSKHPIAFHFIVDADGYYVLSNLLKTWIIPAVSFHLYNASSIENRVEWVPNQHYSGKYGLIKLLISEILPGKLEKVILLDTDVLVLTDIYNLYSYFNKMNLSNVYGMTENLSQWYLTESSSTKVWPAIGRGFNSGVSLVYLERMRKLKWDNLWRETAVEHLRHTSYANLADQDILNALFVKHPDLIYQLPCEFNIQLGLHSDAALCPISLKNIQIAHWNSPLKNIDLNLYTDYLNPKYRRYADIDGDIISVMRTGCTDKVTERRTITATAGECWQFSESIHHVHRTHLMLRNFDQEIQNKTITLVTQMSIDRLSQFEALVTNWKSPISITIYGTDAEVNQIMDHINESPVYRAKNNIAYNAVYKQKEYYPINYLRNVALKTVWSPYVFLLDIDFVPSIGIQEEFEILSNLKDRTAYVVPAFEISSSYYDFTQLPLSKKSLLPLLENSTVRMFRNDVWSQGHAPTNYSRWRFANETYDIQWKFNYEPYVIMKRLETPLYDERFVGFGWNKVTHIMKLNQMNFTFTVLPSSFAIHQPHSPSIEISKYRSSSVYRKCMKMLKGSFVRDLLISS